MIAQFNVGDWWHIQDSKILSRFSGWWYTKLNVFHESYTPIPSYISFYCYAGWWLTYPSEKYESQLG
jgi:hypothetical protein